MNDSGRHRRRRLADAVRSFLVAYVTVTVWMGLSDEASLLSYVGVFVGGLLLYATLCPDLAVLCYLFGHPWRCLARQDPTRDDYGRCVSRWECCRCGDVETRKEWVDPE